MDRSKYKENTIFQNQYFPFNVFKNTHMDHELINLHWHDYMEIIYLIEGNVRFDINGEIIEAGPGHILFVNKGELHAGYVTHDEGSINCIAMVFHPCLLKSKREDICLKPYMDEDLLLKRQVRVEDKHYLRIRGFIENLIEEMEHKETGYEVMIANTIASLVITMIRNNYIKRQDKNTKASQYKESFEELFQYIATHYDEKITIKQAGKIVHLSSYHFCRVFKQLTGRTFTNFMKVYRVNEAEKLLRQTNLTVTEIANRTGFGNINYFDQVFKQVKGYSPSKSRKSDR